jgi:hypothetical protein
VVKQAPEPVEVLKVPQPQLGRAVNAAVSALNRASAAPVIALVTLALVGADIGVAVSRTSGSSSTAPSTASQSPGTVTTPGHSPWPTSPPTTPSGSVAGETQQRLRALIDRAFAKGLAQHSVHSVARNVTKQGTAIFVDDDAVTGGIQRISIYGGHIEIRVIGPTTYFTGDRRGLKRYFRFSDAEIGALNGKWLSLVAGQAGYQQITAGVTLSSTLHEDAIAGHLKREAEKAIDGHAVYGISGRSAGEGAPKGAHATLWVDVATGLPVEFDAANGKQTLTQTFSDWGKPIKLKAPTDVFGQRGSQV